MKFFQEKIKKSIEESVISIDRLIDSIMKVRDDEYEKREKHVRSLKAMKIFIIGLRDEY